MNSRTQRRREGVGGTRKNQDFISRWEAVTK